jgi:hypothetical protein
MKKPIGPVSVIKPLLFDFSEQEFLRPWQSDTNDPVIHISDDYSTVFGIEPEFVAFYIPGKSNLVITHLPGSSPCFLQFQYVFSAVGRILDLRNIGPNVLGPPAAAGRGGNEEAA